MIIGATAFFILVDSDDFLGEFLILLLIVVSYLFPFSWIYFRGQVIHMDFTCPLHPVPFVLFSF